MIAFAQFISYLFHPLFVNFFACVLAIFLHPSLQGRIEGIYLFQIILLFFVSLIVIPLLCIYTFKRSGFISSWQMPERQERILPYIFITLLLAITAYNLWESPSFNFCAKMVLCAAVALFFNTILLNFTKPSTHTMAMTGAATAFLKEGISWHNNSLIIVAALLFIFAGITATSRLILKAHTFSEIILGALIGILVILPII